MIRAKPIDVDFLAARAHGRRSRMFEAKRLDALCRIRNPDHFTRTVYPTEDLPHAAAFQRHSVQSLVRELADLRASLSGAPGLLLEWLLVRYQVENLKVLHRASGAQTPLEAVHARLLELPGDLALNLDALLAAGSSADFVPMLPRGRFRQSLEHSLARDPETARNFFFEAVLDQAYLAELVVRAGRITGEDREHIVAMARQEADIFHLMLVVRGMFHYRLPPRQLLPLHVAETRIPRARFGAMLRESDLMNAVDLARGRALDELPSRRDMGESIREMIPIRIEALAWKRFQRLAHHAFRRGHLGLGAVFGYMGLRRVETANLITLSEGIRGGIPPEAIRAHLNPAGDLEAAHV